jgi:signal transduction histidine kinase/ligand-binding sensor domain-containing protein
VKISLLILACLAFALPVYTQSLSQYHNFTIKKLTQNEGLSQGSNYFLHEDKQGFMWITANDALNRYDGSWVKVYKEERYFKNCPVLKQGYCFSEDSESNIYIGSTIGLYKYNRRHDDFTLLKVFSGYADENCIPFAFRDNKIWCYNRFYAIAAIDIVTGEISFYKGVKAAPIESIHTYMFFKTKYRYRQPFFDKKGILWITTESTIISDDLNGKTISYYMHNDMMSQNLQFSAVCYDSNSNRIVAGTTNGLCLFDIKYCTAAFISSIQNKALGNIEIIQGLNADFVYNNQKEAYIVSRDFKQTSLPGNSHNPQLETSTSNPVYVDSHNRLWLCKSGFGLTILDFSRATFSKESGYKEDPNYFFKTGTHSFAEYPNGDILIRCGPQLFIKHHFKNDITELKQYHGAINSLPLRNDYLRNGIWLFYNGKIILLDCKTNKPVFAVDCNENKYGAVQDIAVLPSGYVWLALSTGIYSIDFIKKKLVIVENLQMPNVFKINLINKNHVAISYLNDDMLLVQVNSTSNASVIRKILPGIKSFYLQCDTAQNKFWVGADDGVYLLGANFMQEGKFNALNDLSGSYVYGLLLGNENNVWVSHEKGLSCINTKSLQTINYDEDDNIQDMDYNNRCFFKANDGTLYFGGIKGFNYFKPPVTIPSFYKPELYIDEISVNNAPAFADTNYTLVQDLKLTPQQNILNIHAVIKDLDILHSNKIIYRFINLDTPWRYLPSNSDIIFNNLAPGDYKLELGYYNTKKKVIVSQKIISISVSSPFYKTILFWVFITAVITAIIAWRYNKIKLIKQKRLYDQQLALMKERNRITADLHDDVGSSLSSLQIHSTIARQIMESDKEKAKYYLDKIIEQSEVISSNVSDIIWSMKSQEDRLIDMDGRIRNTISNLLGATNIDYTIDLVNNLEDAVQNITARKNIMLIIKEALNNCAKYSNATQCTLSVTFNEETLMITVNDNGKGIPVDKIKTGNGLQNMRKRTSELNGIMHLETAENAGVHLKFIIPTTEIRG